MALTRIARILLLMAVVFPHLPHTTQLSHTTDRGEAADGVGRLVVALLTEEQHPSCSVVVFTDAVSSPATILKEVAAVRPPWGVVVLQNGRADNATGVDYLPHLIRQARQVRMRCPCASVVVLSDDLAFLASFGRWSLRERLLAWSTRALVATRLPLQEVRALFAAHWTYSMMNTMVLLRDDLQEPSWGVYGHLPYMDGDGGHLVRLASWSPLGHLSVQPSSTLFPDKFSNFNEATVNVTALPYKPYWATVDGGSDSSSPVRYTGSDRLLLEAMAQALNFTIRVLPVETWEEVVKLVEERVSFVASVVHMMLPQRAERFGFTRTYEHGVNLAFGMSKPSLRPRWQSLYYPLSDNVWLSVLVVVLFIPPILYVVANKGSGRNSVLGAGAAVEIVLGTFLGHSVYHRVPEVTSTRVLLGSWMVFSLVIGTAYRGNLIASLALPKYPPRPENLEQLVKVVYRITMPSYGADFQDFLKQSESPSFRAIGQFMRVGVSVMEGLQQATERQAHIDGHRYLEQMIAERFTQEDGSSRLYVGREGVIPGLNGWPIPHEAPYQQAFDRVITVVQEAGLYNKWMDDMLQQARQEGREKWQKQQSSSTAMETKEDASGATRALTVVHLQGPLLILLLGLGSAVVAFVIEISMAKFVRSQV